MSGKQLVNLVDRCVEDSLDGIVAVNPGLRLLQGHRVVVRADLEEAKKNVAVISGGGSGHEPSHAGFVGQGMLTGAVAGAVFTSPPPDSILAAIRTCCGKDGILVVVKNYTGDRLNFGIAAERAKAEGYKVDMVVIGEDCALTSADKTAGRRGLAGALFIHKIAGALAVQGKSLEDIVKEANLAKNEMGTIGVSLSSCSVPGKGPMFKLADDELELGLGIHGEAGVKRVQMSQITAKQVVDIMLSHMTNPSSQTCLNLSKGDCLALMVNNLGGTSVLEMNIIAKEAIEWLENHGYMVQRAYCGTFMTSLQMAGVSLSVMRLNDTRKSCLDYPTRAPGWVMPMMREPGDDRSTPSRLPYNDPLTSSMANKASNVSIDPIVLHTILTCVCHELSKNKDRLNLLDTESGDGDCGTTMKCGADAILERLGEPGNSRLPVESPHDLSLTLAQIIEREMGGSSGALYSLFLCAAAGALKMSCNKEDWMRALEAGIQAVQKYGQANPGDRTMLDALHPTWKVLAENIRTKSELECFELAADAAELGAKKTTEMKARAGRASYVNEELLRQPDPGASAVAIWIRAACQAFKSLQNKN